MFLVICKTTHIHGLESMLGQKKGMVEKLGSQGKETGNL